MNRSLIGSGLVAVVVFAGCANFASFQEADVMPVGQHKTGFGATFTKYEVENEDGTFDSISVPAVNIWYRMGIAEKLEAHASVWIPFGASIGAKYQILGERTMPGLAVSVGLDVGALQIGSENVQGEDRTLTVVDVYVPVYLGYRTGPGFAGYFTPKFIERGFFGGSESEFNHMVGGTLGIALGERSTFYLEGTYVRDLSLDINNYQGGIGIGF